MPTEREKERARKLAQKSTKDPFKVDAEQQAQQKAIEKREAHTNNARTREGLNKGGETHLPTLRKTKKQIEEELTQK